ncbi:hypothetical protein SAMN05421578_106138 [Paenibacillus macquariensis]|uniref:Transposase n=1 Tax=Paenibacillus macquariensis TaxID=948756 RepID=A0ABY1JZQ5_9BACL|nr:hypothetical protein SAMN05421578_106138 [Paenibacillus macquariensis]
MLNMKSGHIGATFHIVYIEGGERKLTFYLLEILLEKLEEKHLKLCCPF